MGSRRRALGSGLAVLVVVVVLGPVPRPARADVAGDEARFLALANRSRAAVGLGQVAVAADLTAVARRHSADMAAQHRLFHTPNLLRAVGGRPQVGEIAGMGDLSIPAWADVVHHDFLASPTHRAVMLNGAFTHVGLAVSYGGGKTWVTEVYARAGSGRAPAVAAPRPSRSRTVVIEARPAPPPPPPAPPPPTTPPTTTAPLVEEAPPPPSVPAALRITMPAKVAARPSSGAHWEGRMMLGLLALAVGGSAHRRRTARL
jgi:hypothetical protein